MPNKPHAPNGPYPVCLHANETCVPLAQALKKDLDQAYAACDFRFYPDPDAKVLRQAAADHYGLAKDQIAVGNGSDEIIDLLFRTFCQPGDPVLLFAPDFGVYRQAAGLSGALVHTLPKPPGQGVDLQASLAKAQEVQAKLILFSNPCNPTGGLTSRETIRTLLASYEGLVVVDEAYMEFSDQSVIGLLADFPRLIVLRTLSKAFGAAGLRIGFALAKPEIAQAIAATSPLYNVGRLSQDLATCYFRHPQALQEGIATILASTRDLAQGLEDLAQAYPGSFTPYPTAANFIYMEMPEAEAVFEALKDQGVLIRRLGPEALRVSAGSREDNQAFLVALAAILKEGRP